MIGIRVRRQNMIDLRIPFRPQHLGNHGLADAARVRCKRFIVVIAVCAVVILKAPAAVEFKFI